MEMTIEQAMDKLLEFKKRTFKDDNVSELSQALCIAFLTMQNYQLLKICYNDRLKADMVAMLEEIKEQLREMHDDLFELANFAKADGVSDSMDVIKKKINKLKENKVANKLRASGQIQDKDRYISISEAKRQMVAILTDIQLEIEEMSGLVTEIHGEEWNEINVIHSQDVLSFIQQKINSLKEK